MWRLVASRLQPLLRPIPVSHALVGACHQQFGPRITLYRFGPSKISQGLLWIGNQEQFSRQAQVFSAPRIGDRKSTRLNSSDVAISYAVFCLKKKKKKKKKK